MIRRGRLCVAMAIGTLALAGCSEKEKETTPKVDPLVFEIANSDGEIEGWMLGTIHALPDGVEWRTPTIAGAIEDADYLFVEVADLDDRAAIADTFTMLATSPDQAPLHRRVSPEYVAQLDDALRKANRTASSFEATETWAAALILARVGATGNPANGVDSAIVANFAGRDVREFEGALAQLRIFDELAEEDQRDLLHGVLDEIEIVRENPDRLRKAWLAGDERALEKTTTQGIMADPQLHDALLVQRNARWAEILDRALASEARPLVAVGAGHLVGPESLRVMLEERGYTVTRVTR